MNTSRYGLPNNDMFCLCGFIKLCYTGKCIKGKFSLKKVPLCTCRLSNNEFQDSLF